MKNIRLAVIALLVLAFAPAAASAGVEDFTIPSFEGDYFLSRDSHQVSNLKVHEHLVAKFPDFDQNHGILRAIPKTYDGHSVSLKIDGITDDSGHSLSYSQSTQNDNLVLKIGDAGTYVHGLQTYIIDYHMKNVTSHQAGYDGFFWDINGNQWRQQFGQVVARVHLSDDIAAAMQSSGTRCFTGASGSTAQDCTATGNPPTITYAATRPLNPGETMTAEARFAPGTFAAYQIPIWQLLLLIIPIPLTLFIMVGRWRRYGRDPQGRGVIIPEYLAPKNLTVLGAGALLSESSKPSHVSATILDLAIRGYLKIYEIKEKHFLGDKTSYELELLKAAADLTAEEQAVVALLFGSTAATGTRVNLSDLKNKLYEGADAIGKDTVKRLVTDGLFRSDPTAAKIPYFVAGVAVAAASLYFLPYTAAVLISGGIILVFAFFMPARTAAGVEQRDYLLGLKQFITVAEADRIKALQSPHGSLTEKIDVTDTKKLVKLYERLLPYAMLFGIEKDWAKQFAALYDTPPGWYSGSSSFNAAYFAGSLSGFSSAAGSSFTAPSSSGSGGSAGGGGGGGGGGGW